MKKIKAEITERKNGDNVQGSFERIYNLHARWSWPF